MKYTRSPNLIPKIAVILAASSFIIVFAIGLYQDISGFSCFDSDGSSASCLEGAPLLPSSALVGFFGAWLLVARSKNPSKKTDKKL